MLLVVTREVSCHPLLQRRQSPTVLYLTTEGVQKHTQSHALLFSHTQQRQATIYFYICLKTKIKIKSTIYHLYLLKKYQLNESFVKIPLNANVSGLTPEQINLIAFLFFSQILRYNKYFKNTKVGPNRSKRFLGISNKAVYGVHTVLEGNCPKKIPKKIFFHLFGPTFTNKYIYIRLLRCKTN